MGEVFAARDPQLGRRVAVKVLHPHIATAQERLLREGQAIASLRHPNVVTVYDSGVEGERLFIAMELVEGRTLSDWLRTPRKPHEILAVFRDAGRGLAAAHRAGIAHRDFKPDNVLVADDGRVVVTDFGLASTTGNAPTPDGQPVVMNELTQPGSFMGTPAYMAPEQLRTEPADERSDQFAFCISLFEAFHGRRPFGAYKELDELKRAVFAGRIVEAWGAQVPARVRRALQRGLSVAPADRHPSMDALLDELAERRSRWWIAGAVVAAGGVAAGIAGLASRSGAGSAASACDDGRAAKIWTEQAREAARSRFPEEDLAFFDRFATTWRELRAATCRAPTSDPARPARVACLDAALAGFSEAIAGRGDPARWPTLPSLQACRDGTPSAVVRPLGERYSGEGSLLLSPQGDRYALLDQQGAVLTVHRLETGQELARIELSDARELLRWSDDDRIAVLAAHSIGTVHIVDLNTKQVAHVGTELLMIWSASRDLREVLTTSFGTLELMPLDDVAHPRVVAQLAAPNELDGVYWRGEGRIAVLFGQPRARTLQIVDPATGRSSTTRFRWPVDSLAWIDDHRLVFDASASESTPGLWSISLDDDGRPTELPSLRIAGSTLVVEGAAVHDRLLAWQRVERRELVRLEGGNPRQFSRPLEASRLLGVLGDGRFAVEREGELLLLTADGVATRLGSHALVAAAATDDGVLGVRDGDILAIDAEGLEHRLGSVPSSTGNTFACCAPGLAGCVVGLQREGLVFDFVQVHGATLTSSPTPALKHKAYRCALHPDGRRLALSGLPAVEVLDLVTKEVSVVILDFAQICARSRYVAWSGEDLLSTHECYDAPLRTRVVRFDPLTMVVQQIHETPGVIQGITVGPRGEVYLGEHRRIDSQVVLIDHP
jgi:hypothetical protein